LASARHHPFVVSLSNHAAHFDGAPVVLEARSLATESVPAHPLRAPEASP
jgi:hypothetical protein